MIGYGLPYWLPDEYMTAEETRALGELDLWASHMYCSWCGKSPDYRGLQRAHIARKGMGRRPKGTTGPSLRLCARCHYEVDHDADVTMAVRRSDRMVCIVWHDGRCYETGVMA
ncbi:MAG: hypothetical protein ABFC80_09540 [Coriobacteriales bacterium]